MAEIKIQEKKNPIWPWILLIIIIIAAAALLYFYLNRNNNNEEIYGTESVDTTEYLNDDTSFRRGDIGIEQPEGDVQQFRDYTERDTGSFSKEYVVNGLNLLSGAVYSVVSTSGADEKELQVRTDSLLNTTRNVSDTTGMSFSIKISKTFNAVYGILRILQEKEYPELEKEINEIRTAARAYEVSKGYDKQQQEIKIFFSKAGKVLSNMKNTASAI